MKFFIALLCVAFVVSVPVSEVPAKSAQSEVKTPESPKAELSTATATEVKTPETPQSAPESPKAESNTATEVKTPEKPKIAPESPKAESNTATEVKTPEKPKIAPESPKAESSTATEVETPESPKSAPESPKAESNTPAAAPVAASVDDSLKQIVSVVEKLAGAVQGDEHKSLVALMQSGMDIIAQAEKRAREIQSKIESQNLLQSDNLFGLKEDGSIDAAAAADQITNLVNIFVGPNTVSNNDKEMLHTMIDTVSQIVTPLMNQNASAATALPSAQTIETLLKLVMPPSDNKKDELLPSVQAIEAIMKLMVPSSEKHNSKDALLQPETLLSMFDSKSEFDVDALSTLATKFMQTFESAMDEEKQ